MAYLQFRFDEATPLQAFIDQYRDRIVGHTLKACYINAESIGLHDIDEWGRTTRSTSEGILFFILDDVCIGLSYLFLSHADIVICEEKDFEVINDNYQENQKLVHFRGEIPGITDEYTSYLTWDPEMPSMNQKIVDVSIGRFTQGYEDSIDSERPDGGDYFSWISLALEDGTEVIARAMNAVYDGACELFLYKPKA